MSLFSMRESRYLPLFSLLACVFLLTARASVAKPPAPGGISRIAICNGHFVVAESGKPFVPTGVNLLHLAPLLSGGKICHSTFSPGVYHAEETERMMGDLAAHRLNTVRAFHVFAMGEGGILEKKTDPAISPGYLANVIDFLQAARRHGIHVIFTWDCWLPDSDQWRSALLPMESDYSFLPEWDPAKHKNNFMISLPSVRTRSNAVLAVIEGVRKADPSLLPVVLAWEIENEAHFDATREPFTSRPAFFSFAGKIYNLNTSEGIQKFMDEAAIQWCNISADAIHHADPEALVSVSLFSFAAVGRPTGPNHLLEDVTEDSRVPVRPLALVRSKLDFIDLHLYMARGNLSSFAEFCSMDFKSVELPSLQQEAARAGKPILIGETGVATSYLPGSSQKEGLTYPFDYRLGLSLLKDHLLRLKTAQFAGVLLWSYGISTDPSVQQHFPRLDLFPEYQEMLRQTWLK